MATAPATRSFTFQVQDDGGTANGGVDLDPSPNTMTDRRHPGRTMPRARVNDAGVTRARGRGADGPVGPRQRPSTSTATRCTITGQDQRHARHCGHHGRRHEALTYDPVSRLPRHRTVFTYTVNDGHGEIATAHGARHHPEGHDQASRDRAGPALPRPDRARPRRPRSGCRGRAAIRGRASSATSSRPASTAARPPT